MDVPQVPSEVYPGGERLNNTAAHTGTNNISAIMSQLIGRNADGNPEPIDAINNALLTTASLVNEKGTVFIYYVRGADVNTPDFVDGSQGRAKKIITIPYNSTPSSIIRVSVFLYQNPTYPTKVTTITDYDEVRSFYDVNNIPKYDANSAVQNNVYPN